MTTPEPSPLSEQELQTLEEYTQSLVCCVCDGPDADGDHDDDCQAPFWQTVSRAIAQARAARPSPWQDGKCSACGAPQLQEGQRHAVLNPPRPAPPFYVTDEGDETEDDLPAPPAQDGGRS